MSGAPDPKIVVIGSVMVDRVVRVPTIVRPGETLAANSIEVHPGGKGANQAAAAALAGATVMFAARTGADGAFVLEALSARGVDVAPSRIDEGASGTAFVQVAASGENAIAIVPEANGRFDRDDLDRALRDVRPGDLVLLQNETALLGTTIESARAIGGVIWLNAAPASPAVPRAMLELVDVLIVNEHEAAAIGGVAEPREALERLCLRLPKALIVVTIGPEGVIAGHGARRWSHAAFAVEAVDTVGCGDAFVGAMAAAIVRGEEVGIALREGCAAGAIAATRTGAIPSLPTRAEIAAMLDRERT
jgi:ribokinase